jgi:class 3 adenylate cyclase/Flp pilus assembly protein TadD
MFRLWLVCALLLLPMAGSPAAESASLASAQGRERLEILLDLGRKTIESAPGESLAYTREALELAEQSGDRRTLAASLNNLGLAYKNQGKLSEAIDAQQQALGEWEALGDPRGEAATLLHLGALYWPLGDYDKALSFALEARKIYESLKDQAGLADSLHTLGIVNDLRGNYPEALEFHKQALEIRTRLDDRHGIADSLNNLGIINGLQENYAQALEYYLKSLAYREALRDERGKAKVLNNIGVAYKELKDYQKALSYYSETLLIWERLGDKYQLSNVLNNIGEIHVLRGEYLKAAEYLAKALSLAREMEAKEVIRENYEFFSKLYEAQSDFRGALAYYRLSTEIGKEIFNENSQKNIANMEITYEVEKQKQKIAIQQLTIARQNLRLASLLGGLVLVFVLALVIHNRYRFARRVNRQLEDANNLIRAEKEKSDKLLLNILPVRVANELKENGTSEPELFENVTVYFSDVVGFTRLSSGLEPKFLIAELNEIFTAFDNIIEKNQCERVKTIGDAYLCVCGMPTSNPRHAENIVRSAIEIVEYMQQRNQRSPVRWEIRIGIHSGKVVGGIVGVKKYIYDVFGDTINTASRMESNSEAMKINISESTYQLVKDDFRVVPRGFLEVKGKGQMRMYFVEQEAGQDVLR